MADIAIYTFGSGGNVLPTFNNDFVYSYTDVDNGDGTITRTITSDDTPTSISFMNTDVKTVEYLNITNKITSLESLFAQCYSLTSFNASNWDTSEVTSMQWMCYRAGNLETIDLSGLNTSKLTNMINMFYECNRAVEYNLSGWDVSKVTNMMQVFYCVTNAHTINIDGWKLNPEMTIDEYMFSSTNKLSVISLKNSTAETINRLIPYFPNCNIEGGRLVITGVDDIDSVDIAAIETKGWTVQSFELNLTNKFVDGDKLNKFAKLLKTNIINTAKQYADDQIIENRFSGDYNDLENRPCYEDRNNPTLTTFVTDPGTKEIITVNGGMSYGFEPDLPLPADISNPVSLTFTVKKSGTTVTEVSNVTPSLNSPGIYTVLSRSGYPLAFIILEDGLSIGNVSVKKGIYVASQAYGNEYVKSITYIVDNSILKQLDEKFIPDTIATKKYVDDKFDIQNFLMPDDFEGTDGEKLQACFDALKDTGGFITINREYVLDRDIVINQDSNLNLQTTVKGIGEVSKINCGPYCFKGKEGVKHSWGGIKFSDLQITGTETMMQCANLIRVICSSCLISDFKYVCYSPDYTQSMYFNECIIRNISESVMFTETPESLDFGNDGTLLDTRICFCLIEWCKHLLTSAAYSGCIIDNNCIEGFTGVPLKFNNGKTRGVVIKNNYFEANEGGAIDLYYLSNQYSQNISIDSNVFVTSDNAEVTIRLPINRVIGSITISNNTTSSYSTPLYEVPASARNYTGVYIYNNYGKALGNTSIIDSNITKLDYANSINNVIKGSVVDINDGAEARKLTNVRYFGKTTQDGIPSVSSPSVPVSLLDKQNFKTYITTTKNILEVNATTATVSGVTFTVASGQIRLSGTTTADDVIFDLNYEQGKLNIPVGTWRMSGPSNTYVYIQLYVDGQLVGQTRSTETLVTVPEGATESYVRLKISGTTGSNVSGTIVSPMLVSADDKDTSPTFEKFNKESFSTTFSNLSNGIHGVPVTSGGNYTDSTGQQWLADCVDFAKGTIDRSFKEITLNGTETWVVQTYSNQPAGMYCYRLAFDNKRVGEGLSRCSHFQNVNKCWEFKQGCFTFSDHGSNRYSYFITDIATIEEWKSWLASNNVKFVYATTNIESEQLSEHNLSQFSVIAVTKSHCRITNDKNCEMEVTYVVDTKTYIETALDEKADKNDLFSKDYNDLTNKPEIPSIEGLATEEYVDNTYLPLTGGLVTGNVQIDGNLVNNNDATFNKQVTFNDIATLGAGANLAGNEVQINADTLVNNAVSTHNQAATFNGEITFNKNVTFGEDAVLSGNKVQIDANTLVNNAVSTHNQAATFNGDVTINSPTTLGAGANLAGNEVQINANTLVNNSPSTHNQAATFNGETTFNSPTTLGAGANLAGNEVQINADALVNNAVSTHNQAATFNNTVVFNEQATFSKDLNVAGNVSVTAETGDAWFNGNISVGADNKQLATEEFVNTMLNGLRLMQITRADYDALETKDPSTLYIII